MCLECFFAREWTESQKSFFFYLSVAKACVSQQHGGDGRSVSSVRQPDSTEGCPRFPCRAEKWVTQLIQKKKNTDG